MKKMYVLIAVLCSLTTSSYASTQCIVRPDDFITNVAVDFDHDLFTISVYGHSRVTYKASYAYQERGLPGMIRKVSDFSTFQDMPETLSLVCNVIKTQPGTTCELKGLSIGDVVFNDHHHCDNLL